MQQILVGRPNILTIRARLNGSVRKRLDGAEMGGKSRSDWRGMGSLTLWFAKTTTQSEVRRRRGAGRRRRCAIVPVPVPLDDLCSVSRHRHREAGPRIDHCPWLGKASGFAGLST